MNVPKQKQRVNDQEEAVALQQPPGNHSNQLLGIGSNPLHVEPFNA